MNFGAHHHMYGGRRQDIEQAGDLKTSAPIKLTRLVEVKILTSDPIKVT